MLRHSNIRVLTTLELLTRSKKDSKTLSETPGENGDDPYQAIRDLIRNNYLGKGFITCDPTSSDSSPETILARMEDFETIPLLRKFLLESSGQRTMKRLFKIMQDLLVINGDESKKKAVAFLNKLDFVLYVKSSSKSYKAYYLSFVYNIHIDGLFYQFDPEKGLIEVEDFAIQDMKSKLSIFNAKLKEEYQLNDKQLLFQLLIDDMPLDDVNSHVDIMACMEKLLEEVLEVKPIIMGIDEFTVAAKHALDIKHDNILLYSNAPQLTFARSSEPLSKPDISKKERVEVRKNIIDAELKLETDEDEPKKKSNRMYNYFRLFSTKLNEVEDEAGQILGGIISRFYTLRSRLATLRLNVAREVECEPVKYLK